jgi:transposase
MKAENKEPLPKKAEFVESELMALKERVRSNSATEEDLRLFDKVINFMLWLEHKLLMSQITMYKLKRIFFGSKTEKNKSKLEAKKSTNKGNVIGGVDAQDEAIINEKSPNFTGESPSEKKPAKNPIKGHGRKAANDYIADEVMKISHQQLKAGDFCPNGCGGRLYNFDPGVFIHLKGTSCAHIVRYEIDKLRCTLCNAIFTPNLPQDFPTEKYDEQFKSILAVQKYYVATPFYRQEGYHKLFGVPLADSTQWDLIEHVADCAYPVLNMLEKEAANGTKVYNDDTPVKILDVIRDNKLNPDKKRTGAFTSCIFSQAGNHKICLYRSGIKHAGENLTDILKNRDINLSPIIHMCDASSTNIPTNLKTIVCNCIAHGRRKFIDIEPFFPKECGHVIEQLAFIYKHDKEAKEKNLSASERLVYHQEHSGPVMLKLKLWLQKQFDEPLVEPNSGLGDAIKYLQKHWIKLTRFLSIAEAPLDNNVVERSLKLAIRVRKNSMFHKSVHGAYVAGLLLSLIHTCELAKKNPINYLTALQKNKSDVFKRAHLWLPWNYETTLLCC